MPDDPKPAPPQATPSTAPISKETKQAQPTSDFGHVPMTEELDSAKWTLPPVIPVLGALVAIAIVVAVIAYTNRPTPSASGAITKVISADEGENVLVAVHLKFNNMTENPLWIKNIGSEVQTADGKSYRDGAAAAIDVDRYLQAAPPLAEGKLAPLREEQKIAAKASHEGMTIFSYPVNKAAFDGRKSLTVRIDFYDRPAMVLKQ